LRDIIRDYTPEDYSYDPAEGDRKAKQGDYDMVSVIPVSDPNSSTMAQRIMQYQAVMQLSAQAPQIYNLPILHRQMIEVLGVKNADKLVPVDDDLTPRDPISENMAFLTGKPTKAFIYQDHTAHIAVHQSMLQDPMVMGQMGQNPMAQQMQAAIMAHIAEHVAFQYRNQIEERLGASLPAPNAELPEQVEVQLSKLVAQAAAQLTQMHQGEAAQKQAMAQAQDPIIQMQQAELQLKKQEIDIKALKVKGDLQLKAEELSLKAQESASRNGEDPAMAAMRLQQEIAQAQELHGLEMAAKQMELQQAQAQQQQAMMQQQQAHGQKMAHGGQVHEQKMRHAAMAAEKMNNEPIQKDE
jgi:hypothetical protein